MDVQTTALGEHFLNQSIQILFATRNRETQVKDRQSSEQILTITKDSLKRSEQDLGLTRTELTAAKRELKDAFRQLEGIQLHLGKGIVHCSLVCNSHQDDSSYITSSFHYSYRSIFLEIKDTGQLMALNVTFCGRNLPKQSTQIKINPSLTQN